ncbi:MAG: polymerase subunit sigma-70 [Bacteroidetes bacterium]|jgi:DNA-directed RNA polymerase specialized sigma24 family protein|nr:polymerase subunit sigma-70 [Bacteroidota bacterium]
METETIRQVQTREEQFIFLYERAFPKTAAFVSRSGGNLEDAKDVFQDALILLYEKEDPESIQDKPSYVAGIARHLWLKKAGKKRSQAEAASEAQSELLEPNERQVSKRLLRYVAVAGKKCMELLTGVYYDKLSMKELASKFEFSGERSATAQKYKCLEKIREVIKQRSLNKEDFYE